MHVIEKKNISNVLHFFSLSLSLVLSVFFLYYYYNKNQHDLFKVAHLALSLSLIAFYIMFSSRLDLNPSTFEKLFMLANNKLRHGALLS